MAIVCQEKLTTIDGCVESISGSEVRVISGWLFRVAPDIVFQGLCEAGQSFLTQTTFRTMEKRKMA
jgi:hypothetical protein